MPIELSPGWLPLAFPIALETELFEPVLLHEKGFLIAGGPEGLVLFSVGKIKGIFATIPKRSWINGFAVHGTELYVQDGPVLLAYELTYGKPLAAINLVTDAHWPENEGDDISEGVPDEIYELDGNDASLLNTLYAARRQHFWTQKRATGEAGAAMLSASATALDTATSSAARIVFSPPVIRSRLVDSSRYGRVFSMRMDGKVYAMDDNLTEAQTFAGPAPLRPELVMAEIPQASGKVLCHLYYVGATGNIVGIDATESMSALRDWPARGTVSPANVLPLRFTDGYLMGGGILGHDFFVMPPDSSLPPVVSVPAPASTTGLAWRHYDVAIAEKMVVVSNGTQSRLVCYHRDAGVRDRWQLRTAPTRAYSIFWTETGIDAPLPGPKLSLEVSFEAAGASKPIEVRAVFANNVDAPNDGHRVNYPPPSTTLATATIAPGAYAGRMQPVAYFACRPAVAQQTMFCIYRSATSSAALGGLFLTAFTLNGLLGAALPEANRKFDEMKQAMKPIRIHVTRLLTVEREWPEPGDTWTEGPFVQKNTQLNIIPQPGTPFQVITDPDGMAWIDSMYGGRRITTDCRGINEPGNLSCGGAQIEVGRVNELRVSQFIHRFK